MGSADPEKRKTNRKSQKGLEARKKIRMRYVYYMIIFTKEHNYKPYQLFLFFNFSIKQIAMMNELCLNN